MDMREIYRVVVHCSATNPSANIGVAEIRDWHVNGNGWSDIGYHDVIRRSGAIEKGRSYLRNGAHTKGFNTGSIGVCLVGGVDDDGYPDNNFTEAQFRSLERLLKMHKECYPDAEICGHRDLSPDANHDGEITKDEWVKDCPCFDVRQFCMTNGIM